MLLVTNANGKGKQVVASRFITAHAQTYMRHMRNSGKINNVSSFSYTTHTHSTDILLIENVVVVDIYT